MIHKEANYTDKFVYLFKHSKFSKNTYKV